ncbi:syntaxin [Fomitiporia mediterranea MF3/22]|uniref:syntaxin n=1 Tax=Fomitiporia mediterranea (strain MF3/22) TaxID=694068 RepID=UPI00044076F5|nr:syntaxin [Fomitiporia mediterranea MF3/22]EJD04043.1 syntaxin [Fomitiporia mediterranea MF3/22]
MAAIHSVRILGHEERSSPKTHVVYKIEVQASVRSWLMWRRYSEFDDLHTELSRSVGDPPPHPLPPKHTFSIFRSKDSPQILQERIEGLEAYLRAIVSSKDERWRETFIFKEFLGIPTTKKDGVEGGAPSEFTSSSWIDEYMDLKSRVQDIRTDVNKRDALADRGDVVTAHSVNVQAKKKLAGVLNRLGNLTRGLEALAAAGLSEGEIQRRTPLAARLQDDCEKLSTMMIASRSGSRAFASSVPANQNPASEADRSDLLGPAQASTNRPFARVFGATEPPQETEQTRPLDDHGVLQLQQTKMEEQDSQLSQLTTILARQHQLGLAINQEISEQNEMLDDLTGEVDRVGGKLKDTRKKLDRVDNS